MAELYLAERKVARIRDNWPAILERVANGERLGAIAEWLGDVSRWNIQRYIRITLNAQAEYDAALEDSAEVLIEDMCATISSEDKALDSRARRVKADYLYKLAAARAPNRYSERRQIDMRVQALDMSDALREAQRRLQQREQALLGKDVTQAGVTLGSVAQLAELL